MNRIIKSLGTFTHFGDTDTQDAEDDDGGFRNGAPCTLSASSGIIKNDSQGAKKPPSTSSSLCTGREKLLYQYGDKVPGVLGLKNHGNTCFMNAVVQCLSNTDLSGEPRRVSGEVTEQLTVVSKYGSQFRGNSQHDALEFLLWLLDRVHEDVILAPHNNNNKVKAPEKVRTTKAISLFIEYSRVLDSFFVCFRLQLAPDDAWKCPHCKQLQQGMVKMSLWTLPDILILHLKRFRQVGERRNKLTTFVHFPLAALDMTPHMVHRNNGPQEPLLQPGWNQSRRPDLTPPDFLYDLYAVCNHHGGMHGGHYTAFCRNSVDGQWYSYDDSSAEPVPEAEVCTRGAYILFYQKRNTIPPWSCWLKLKEESTSPRQDPPARPSLTTGWCD
uniref:Ubiquitin carboxyl-terminal hydrolase n=1 Tax=Oryzias sinensis TaxID=183150 RepID=A0A8C8DW08_9TELE